MESIISKFTRKIGRSKEIQVTPTPFEVSSDDKTSPPWYRPDSDLMHILTPETTSMLSKSTGLSGEELEKEILDVRARAFNLGRYPSIGGFHFLRPIVRQHPLFSDVVKRLQAGDTLLEIGAGLGQNLAYMAEAGAPTDKMYAVDSRLEVWNLGRRLFPLKYGIQGKTTVPQFIEADLVAGWWSEKFLAKHGQVDIVLAGQFFDTMADEYGLTILRWLKPLLRKDAIVVGWQVAADEPFTSELGVFYHNQLSFWGNWQGISIHQGPKPVVFQLDSWQEVDLEKDWGWIEAEWRWIDQKDMKGVYYHVNVEKSMQQSG